MTHVGHSYGTWVHRKCARLRTNSYMRLGFRHMHAVWCGYAGSITSALILPLLRPLMSNSRAGREGNGAKVVVDQAFLLPRSST